MQSDIFGLPIYLVENKNQACLGACITASVGLGYYKSYKQAVTNMVKLSKQYYKPNLENHHKYLTIFKKYQELYQANKTIFVSEDKIYGK